VTAKEYSTFGYRSYAKHYPQIIQATKQLQLSHGYQASGIINGIHDAGWSALMQRRPDHVGESASAGRGVSGWLAWCRDVAGRSRRPQTQSVRGSRQAPQKTGRHVAEISTAANARERWVTSAVVVLVGTGCRVPIACPKGATYAAQASPCIASTQGIASTAGNANVRNEKVRGSNPLSSTQKSPHSWRARAPHVHPDPC
jgi:hypothetical protein